jgi:RNA recognition motif-containing protein
MAYYRPKLYNINRIYKMNIYVGNIAHKSTEEDIKKAFSAYGEVSKASIVKDKFTGDSRGFGFIEMANDEEAKKAIAELNGKELEGRPLTVNEARPREEKASAAVHAVDLAAVHAVDLAAETEADVVNLINN